VTEYAAGLAQFKAGNIYAYEVNLDDILSTKQDVPELSLYQGDIVAPTGVAFYGFREGSVFRDERVRQAFSLAQDRDLWISTFFNTDNLAAAGIPLKTAWNTTAVTSAVKGGWWLDPQSKDFGENAKYFKHDVAEAKKLLAAAGFPNGVDTETHHVTTNQYGRQFAKQVEVMLGMADEAGLRIKIFPVDFQTVFQQQYRNVFGDFTGMSWVNITPGAEIGAFLSSTHHSTGSLFKGFDPDGKGTKAGDPYLDDLTIKIRQEFDTAKRLSLAHDLQRYDAKKQYQARFPGGATNLELAWPAVANYRGYLGDQADYYWWIDSTKAPMKQA